MQKVSHFSAHLYKGGANDVIITPTGNKIKDFAAANAKAGVDQRNT